MTTTSSSILRGCSWNCRVPRPDMIDGPGRSKGQLPPDSCQCCAKSSLAWWWEQYFLPPICRLCTQVATPLRSMGPRHRSPYLLITPYRMQNIHNTVSDNQVTMINPENKRHKYAYVRCVHECWMFVYACECACACTLAKHQYLSKKTYLPCLFWVDLS